MVISAYLGVAGLVDVGYRFYTTTETAVAPRVTAGIVDAGNGWYSADGVTIPGTAASVRWDSTGTPTALAREYFDTLEATNFATVNTKLDTIDDFLDTEIAAIQTKVNALPSDPADASDIAASFATLNTKIDTIDDFLDTEVAAIKSKTDNLPVDPADASDLAASFAVTNGKIDTVAAKTNNLPTDPADASDLAASFVTVNGKLDTISGAVDTEIAAIKAKTDQLTFTGGKVDANATLALVAADLLAIADAVLKRDFTAISGEAAYSLLNAARMLRNVWATTGGTLSVKKEDGSTIAWTRTLAVDPTAQPIVGAT